jgi:hypothetical protein
MAGELIIACPTCSQKYRVRPDRVGKHAVCKKCNQRFRLDTEQPIDDETILGWVMDNDMPDQSIMGSTSIFQPVSGPKARPTIRQWKPIEPPEKPRVRFERLDETGAVFEFPARELNEPDIRRSFPLKCIHCLKTSPLEVHLLIWDDKLPRQDSFHRKELVTKALGRLDQLLRTQQMRWVDTLEPLSVFPSPFCNPFPYFVCHGCSAAGEIKAQVTTRESHDYCKIAIANLDIAVEFFENNGGRNAPGHRLLTESAKRHRDDRWRRLSFPVRSRISNWFKLDEDERFLGFFADSDFSRSEAGVAGVVLTNHRMIYKKYSTRREYVVKDGGKLDIEADVKRARVRIVQDGLREASLNASPRAASTLAKSLAKSKHPWKVHVHSTESNT